ncbi:hypothetical protein TgHK011_006535 [Trichoderma gracile]|nr:hypothetical protein TgHK011_006535 [Trichoderma gracile]
MHPRQPQHDADADADANSAVPTPSRPTRPGTLRDRVTLAAPPQSVPEPDHRPQPFALHATASSAVQSAV